MAACGELKQAVIGIILTGGLVRESHGSALNKPLWGKKGPCRMEAVIVAAGAVFFSRGDSTKEEGDERSIGFFFNYDSPP